MKPIEVLRQARALISDRDHWMCGNYASGPNGKARKPNDEDAVRWCALGAIIRVGGYSLGADRAVRALQMNTFAVARLGVSGYNDTKGHTAMLAVFDQTIAQLEAKELEAIPVAEPERPEVLTPA